MTQPQDQGIDLTAEPAADAAAAEATTATSGAPVSQAPAPLGRGTLGRQLVIRVTALVAVMAMLISAGTAVATHQLLIRQIDDQLDAVIARAQRADPGGRGGPGQQLVQPGQPIGAFVALFSYDDTVRGGRILVEGRDAKSSELDEVIMDQLKDLAPGTRRSIDLGGDLGRYRISAVKADISFQNGQTTEGVAVVGLPLADLDALLLKLVISAGLLTLLAMAGAAFAARTVVVRSLRPLNRVAATAQQVSQLELDRGEVAVDVRVPAADADPSSEVGRVGQAINHMINNVEGALAARQASEMKVRQFVADASHELRNPLAAIRGYAELTRRGRDDLPPDAAYAMSRVESETDRMSRLVEDLLLLARLDSGPALDLGPTDLTELVINAVSDSRAAGPDHRWTLDLPDTPVTALGDQHRLHQVVANLLANARTHTPAGTTVRTGIAIQAQHAVITVVDNGPGIPADIADQVFERFTRADASRVRTPGTAQGGSTGLGLAIVAAVVEAHHGSVEVHSRPGHTEFGVRIPLAQAL